MASIKNLFSLCHLLLVLLIAKADSKCQKSYPCRNFTIEFPFTDINRSKCGLFPVNCDLHQENPRVYFGAREFPMDLVKKVSANKFLIHDPVLANYFNGNSCFSFEKVSLLNSPSVSFTFSPNLTSFSCYNPTQDVQNQFSQYRNKSCDVLTIYYYKTDEAQAENAVPPGCTMIQIPIKSDQDFGSDVFKLLSPNFTLEWHVSEDCNKCYDRGGQCLTNDRNEFYCKQGNARIKNIIVIGSITIAALASTLTILFLLIRRRRAMARQEHERDIKLFLKNNGNLAPMRYKYSTIKKITKSFSEKLGREGFGSVYKGQLPDGQLVAVKVLHESDGNGENFMNEVASISRTSHVSIVSLLGFCLEGSKRALIYDFMPNGSLEKFIGNTVESGLGWDKLFG